MIGLVFSRAPHDPSDLSKWEAWAQLPRAEYGPTIEAYYEAQRKQNASTPEPTAKKVKPRWFQQWKRTKKAAE